jgi:hypothetical protein
LEQVWKIRPPAERDVFQMGIEAHSVCQSTLQNKPAKYADWSYELGLAFADLTRAAIDKIEAIEKRIKVRFGDSGYDAKPDVWGWRLLDPEADVWIPVVVDHKTAATPKESRKTEDALRKDIQALLYAYAVMVETKAESCIAHWHWLPKKRRANALDAVEVTEVEITFAEAFAAAEWAAETSLEMEAAALQPEPPQPYFLTVIDPLHLRCSGDDGKHYSCPFLGKCEDMSFLEELKKKRAAQGSAGSSEKGEKAEPKEERKAEKSFSGPARQVSVNPDPTDAPTDVDALIDEAANALGKYGMEFSAGAVTGYLVGKYGKR